MPSETIRRLLGAKLLLSEFRYIYFGETKWACPLHHLLGHCVNNYKCAKHGKNIELLRYDWKSCVMRVREHKRKSCFSQLEMESTIQLSQMETRNENGLGWKMSAYLFLHLYHSSRIVFTSNRIAKNQVQIPTKIFNLSRFD